MKADGFVYTRMRAALVSWNALDVLEKDHEDLAALRDAARLVVDAEYRRSLWGPDTEATFDRAVAVLRETVFNERDLA